MMKKNENSKKTSRQPMGRKTKRAIRLRSSTTCPILFSA